MGWKNGKVLRHVMGKDGVERGVVLLHNGNSIERPLQLICPLEIRSHQVEIADDNESRGEQNQPERNAKQQEMQKIEYKFALWQRTENCSVSKNWNTQFLGEFVIRTVTEPPPTDLHWPRTDSTLTATARV